MVNTKLTLAYVARAYGLSQKNLLEYEAMGLVSPTLVGTDRLYTDKDFLRIKIIGKGKKLGFSLQEIKQIIEARVVISTSAIPQDGKKS